VAFDLSERNPDSALVMIRKARTREPDDLDLQLAEATYLSWTGRFSDAVLRYDTIIAAHPELDQVRLARARVLSWDDQLSLAARGYMDVLDRSGGDATARRDAAFGLAQVSAWQGNLSAASERYASLLADDPTEARSLVGLAAVRNWQGRPFAARELLLRLDAADAANRDVAQLLNQAARAISPALELQASWGRDSDNNKVVWQTATQNFLLQDGMKVWGSFGSQRASDPVRLTTRLLGELGASASSGLAQFTALVGARQMDISVAPGGPRAHTEFTWRGSAAVRVRNNVTLGAGASHVPFDEVAALLERGLNLSSYDASAEWKPQTNLSVAASGGIVDFSDGNQRRSVMLRLTQRITPALSVGALARSFAFDFDGDGYFTPERFVLADLNFGWDREVARWSLSLSGGGGLQRLGPNMPEQGQWHVDARAGVRISQHATVGLHGGTTTSAAASAVGAYRYQSAGLSARVVF
jgi:tetratricopeptide (TPR) repeat protein